jgi:hypothetical protein
MAVSTFSAFGGTWFCGDHVVATPDVPPADWSWGHGLGDVALRPSAKRAEGAGALSVVEQLGVADLAQGLAEARQLWQDWVEQDPRLASAPAVDGLRDWLMLVGIDAADEVLHALVQIGSPSGKDCRPAAWVVAWALLPGAIAIAQRAPAGPETDALVASQLWLEIRQFPWWRHQKVAGNVLANMRSVLAREGMLKRPSWAERRTVPTDRLPEQQLQQVSPNEELIDVLSWGEQVGLIGSGDRLLLSSLVEQTDRLGVRTVCRSGQGLMSASALAETAAEFGLSPGTVRRRARRSIDALASACRSGRFAPSI